RGIAEGLAYAHASGVIHRDIKPGNILITGDGTPKITDWGLGKEMADQNETRYIAFSLDYASPEQISPGQFGRGDERIDIFQLGMVFYELLTGKKPFDGEGMGAVTIAIMTHDPRPPSMVEATLRPFDAIIQKCLRKDPDDRYRSVREFISDLDMVACTNCT
ncbi:MAG: serine/threonine-protein kinase, partial [Methanocalculus sp.]|uniref:serine/threonine protein kinase n=1 Tax=Methanocalculus sp. TaxID=2004547 RepID=UPI00271B8F56